MKSRWEKVLETAVLAFCTAVFFCGCFLSSHKTMNISSEDALELVVTEDVWDDSVRRPRYEENEGLICVLFGYGFNATGIKDRIIAKLSDKYGIYDEAGGSSGIIYPVVFPDDVKGRISRLYDLLSEKNLRGVFVLGAPENTHKVLVKLVADWGGECPYPIFSFMPQDEILGQEATCDFVLEYDRSGTSEVESEDIIIDKTEEDIVLRGVRYMNVLPGSLKTDGIPTRESMDLLLSHVQSIVGEKKVHRYIDGESGIQSINHFVIEKSDAKNVSQ